MKKAIFFIVIVLCLIFCLDNCKGKQDESRKNSKENVLKEAVNGFTFTDSIENFFQSTGVVSFVFSDKNRIKKFKILNKDGSLYALVDIVLDEIIINETKFKLTQFANDKSLMLKYDFSPKEFYPELSVIQFEYMKIEGNKVEIFVNKEKSILKYIEVSTVFKIEDWRKHLIGCMIDFNKKSNVIRVKPDEQSLSLNYESTEDDLIFVITDIKGDWVKIECSEICDCSCSSGKKYDGWIKWKKQNKLTIRLLYSC